MKPLFVLVALLLAFVALAPTAQAESPATPAQGPPEVSFPACVPAAVGTVCFSPYWPGCNLWVEWTAIPLPPSCLYRTDGLQTQDSGPTLDCMPVYSRTDVETVSVVRRNSCAAPEAYQCPYQGAPINECDGLLEFSAAAAGPGGEFPWPGGQTPDVQCMDVYSQTYLANGYWLVRRDSCSAQVYQCPDGYAPPAPPCREASLLEASSSSAFGGIEGPGLDCYMVYTRNDIGTISVVRRTSCSVPEVYQCPYEGAPISSCQPLLTAQAAAAPGVELPPVYCMPYEREIDLGGIQVVQGGCGSYVRVCDDRVTLDWDGDVGCLTNVLAAGAASEPACLDVYRETEVGPVRIVSRDSCHAEATVCDRDAKQLTDPMQTDDLWQRRCVEETLDRYIAWG